jgi:hypothetical protein
VTLSARFLAVLPAALLSCSDPTTTGAEDEFDEQGWVTALIRRLGKPLEEAVREVDRGALLTPESSRAPTVLVERDGSGAFEVRTKSSAVRVRRHGGPWSVRPSVLEGAGVTALRMMAPKLWDLQDKTMQTRIRFAMALGCSVAGHSSETQ